MAAMLTNAEMTLEKFIDTFALPQRAKVEEGYQDPTNDDLDLSTNDVIDVIRVTCPSVELTFCDIDGGKTKEKRLVVPTSNKTRFRIKTVEGRVFNSVQDLANAWPLNFKVDHVPLNAFATVDNRMFNLKKDDILRPVRITRQRSGIFNPPDLECKLVKRVMSFTTSSELIRMATNYEGRFTEYENEDDTQSFTLAELVQLARVPRTLSLYCSEQQEDCWILGLPKKTNHIGTVIMSQPEYLVELAIVASRVSDSDDDEDSGPDNIHEDTDRRTFLVPLGCDIMLSMRSSDYESLVHNQFMLKDFKKYVKSRSLAYVVRILDWLEETVVLENHFVRPLDQLVLYRIETDRKVIAVLHHHQTRGSYTADQTDNLNREHQHQSSSFYLIPVKHRGPFVPFNTHRRHSNSVNLSTIDSLPFQMVYAGCGSLSDTEDRSLPVDQPMTVEQVVEEPVALVAKLFDGKTVGRAFYLPLRTKLIIGVIESCKYLSQDADVRMTSFSNHSEKISECVYQSFVSGTIENGVSQKPSILSTKTLVDIEPPPPLKPRANRSVSDPSDRSKSKPCPALPPKRAPPRVAKQVPNYYSAHPTSTDHSAVPNRHSGGPRPPTVILPYASMVFPNKLQDIVRPVKPERVPADKPRPPTKPKAAPRHVVPLRTSSRSESSEDDEGYMKVK